MTVRILLGPQSPNANIRQAVEAMSFNGPIVVIAAGWRDSEGEIDDLEATVQAPIENLMIYQRAEELFTSEPELHALHRRRQARLLGLQRLYRIRLGPTLTAARKLMRETAEPELLQVERAAAIEQIRELDKHHLHRILDTHQEFDERRASLPIESAIEQREAVQRQVADAGLVLIAGGHVAVLLNRIRLFRLGELLAQKPLIAWSAGAMALSDRIVLFHHHAPQGKRDAELLDAGLGIVPGRVLLPHAKSRLDWHNRKRMALFSQRFAPATCCTLDNGSMIRLDQDRVTAVTESSLVTESGKKQALAAP